MLSASVSLYVNGRNIINWNINLRDVHGMYEVDTYYRSCVPSNVYVCVCICECVSTVGLTYFSYYLYMSSFSIQKCPSAWSFLNFQ